MEFEKMGFSKEEFEQANSMFKNMFGQFENSAKDIQAPPETTVPDNPFLAGYQQSKPADGANPFGGGFGGVPNNIGEILNDKEFQNFFEEFTSQMMGGEGPKLGEDGQAEMMKNLMGEFTGFMK